MNKKTKRPSTLAAVLSGFAKYPATVSVSLLLAVIYVAANLYTPYLTGKAVDMIVGEGQVDFDGILKLLILFGGAVVISSAVQWVMNFLTCRVAHLTVRDIRREAFRKLESLPLSYLDTHAAGDVQSRIMSDTEQIESGLVMSITGLVTGVLTVVSIIVILFFRSPVVAAVVLLVTPLSLFCAGFIAKRSFTYFTDQSKTKGELSGVVDEAVRFQRTVRANGAEDEMLRRFDDTNARATRASLRAIFVSSLTNPVTRFINNLVFAGVALTGALGVVGGGVSVGSLSCFLSYTNQYTKPFNEITGILSELQNSAACAARVFEFLDESSEVSDEGKAELPLATGEVVLRDVDFSYVPERPLIEDLTLTVHPGQTVAIVGPTGCGKTTLINLLMRFYDVTGGSVSVDGKDIREITRKSLRESFGMVLQDTWIRYGTVRDNIAMGRPDATDEEIEAAARLSHAHSFIKRLPEGYDTVIDEGDGLSEGQRQLLCIARVMLRRPPMLILDEATSSIDTRTEVVVQDAFLRLMEGRTAFVVAHRLSTVREADVILVMRDGHIVESGTHGELMEKDGFYAELCRSRYAPSEV